MKLSYKMLYMVVEALELLRATWQEEAKGLDEERDEDRLGDLGNDLAYLDCVLAEFRKEKDVIANQKY